MGGEALVYKLCASPLPVLPLSLSLYIYMCIYISFAAPWPQTRALHSPKGEDTRVTLPIVLALLACLITSTLVLGVPSWRFILAQRIAPREAMEEASSLMLEVNAEE